MLNVDARQTAAMSDLIPSLCFYLFLLFSEDGTAYLKIRQLLITFSVKKSIQVEEAGMQKAHVDQ